MPVLIEAISVVIRKTAIEANFPSWWSFIATVPNKTLCWDGDVARVGFMTPMDVGAFATSLEQAGLVFLQNNSAADFVVVDQQRGPTTKCDWLEIGFLTINGHRVMFGRLVGNKSLDLVTPIDWVYERSLSASFNFVPNEDVDQRLQYLRNENGIDVFLDHKTGKEVFIARTSH